MRKVTIAVAFLVAWVFAVPPGWAQKYTTLSTWNSPRR